MCIQLKKSENLLMCKKPKGAKKKDNFCKSAPPTHTHTQKNTNVQNIAKQLIQL